MTRELTVSITLGRATHVVGRLWCRFAKGRESASFEYSKEWLDNSARFSLEPALSLGPGPHHTQQGRRLFGAIGDSAPDRWGRLLARREQRRISKESGAPLRSLSEVEVLLQVNDVLRQGALRFSDSEGGPFLSPGTTASIPPLVDLPKLLNASNRFHDEPETFDELRLLLAPGSSLGGARPKAAVIDGNCLHIAKFPSKTDDWPVVRWEAVLLDLAVTCGLRVNDWKLTTVNGQPVLLVKRFDRDGELGRIHFVSAMSMLNADDNDTRSYPEIAEIIKANGATASDDLRELFARVAFSILCSNTDDHLRNHGFLYCGTQGWRLSPLYDVNPTPLDVKPRIHATEIDVGVAEASLELLLDTVAYYGLTRDQGVAVIKGIGSKVRNWRQVAKRHGLTPAEAERMESAFEHHDLAFAKSI